MNLKELLQFSDRNGKVMVVNEDGEVKGVFLSYEEYKRLAGAVGGTQSIPAAPDPEKINREILEAQLSETIDTSNQNLETIQDDVDGVVPYSVIMPTPIKNILHRRAKDLFMSQPYGRQEPPHYDLREEVIDPTFGQPFVDTEGDEEIKPNFDDI